MPRKAFAVRTPGPPAVAEEIVALQRWLRYEGAAWSDPVIERRADEHRVTEYVFELSATDPHG